MQEYVELLGCDGTALYENDNYSIKFNTSGRLELMIAFDGLVLLKLNDFQYSVDPTHEILCEKNDPQFQMVLYLKKFPTGKWILKINEHSDEVYSCLNQKCFIKDKIQQKSQFSNQKQLKISKVQSSKQEKVKQKKAKQKKEQIIYQKSQKPKKYKQKVEEGQEQQKGNKNITASSVLVSASKGLGWGLKMTGKILSKGFQAAGNLASKAVKPAQKNIQVSQNAKANIQFAKKTSKTVLGFAATQVGNIVKFGKQTVSNVGERFEKSQKGKQMQSNPKYQTVKQGTKTGVQVVSNIYEGVVNAVYQIGSGISKGSSQVIGKKYGDECGQAADDLFQGVGNVIKISRTPQDQLAKQLK